MFSKIFVAYDVSRPSVQALQWGLAVAGEKTEILAYHVIPRSDDEHPFKIVHEIEETIAQDIKREARLFMGESRAAEIKISVKVLVGHPRADLLKAISDCGADLVVVGTHGRTGLSHVLLGSVAEEIVRYSTVPVLVAKNAPSWPARHLLVPYDFSESGEAVLGACATLARTLNARVELLNVVEPGVPAFPSTESTVTTYVESLRQIEDHARVSLKQVAQNHPSLAAQTSVVVGPVADSICDRAIALHSDLIVMPTEGRTGLVHMFSGSVTESVARYSKVSVLTFVSKKHQERRRQVLKN